MSRISQLKRHLMELGIRPKRSLGQNFLVADWAIERIIQAVKELRPDSLVEVGPGLGALTQDLIQLQLPLQVIELDRELVKYWETQQVSVLEADALKLDWSTLKLGDRAVLVSNLPYQISTGLVVERSFGPNSLKAMVLMFQKEVALRLLASERQENYGMLSVMAQSFWDIQYLLEAGPRDFYPEPKIASRVLVFQRKDFALPGPQFLGFLKSAFAQRRKVLRKNLESQFSPERIASAFETMKLGESVRAEELSPTQFHELFAQLQV